MANSGVMSTHEPIKLFSTRKGIYIISEQFACLLSSSEETITVHHSVHDTPSIEIKIRGMFKDVDEKTKKEIDTLRTLMKVNQI